MAVDIVGGQHLISHTVGFKRCSRFPLIWQETLRVKDEELQQMARELRARDHTIKELSDRLHETAEAAEAAAAAATALHVERRAASAELEQMYQQKDDYVRPFALEVMNSG